MAVPSCCRQSQIVRRSQGHIGASGTPLATVSQPSVNDDKGPADHRDQAKRSGGLLLRLDVESSARKMKVDAADRWVLVTDYDLFSLPGQEAPVHRISIVVRRDADPVAKLEADVLTLWRPILRLVRLRFLCDLDCVVGRHLSYVAMPDRGYPVIPAPYHRSRQKGLDLGSAVLSCEPNRVIGGKVRSARLLTKNELPAVSQHLAEPMYVCVDALEIGAAFGEQFVWVKVDAEERSALVDQLLRQLASHIADRQAHRVHERTLLDPPAEGLHQSLLAGRIKAP